MTAVNAGQPFVGQQFLQTAVASAQRLHDSKRQKYQQEKAESDPLPDEEIHRPGAEMAQQEINRQAATDDRGQNANRRVGNPATSRPCFTRTRSSNSPAAPMAGMSSRNENRPGIIVASRSPDLNDDGPLPGAVQLHQHQTLPGAETQATPSDRYGLAGPQDRRLM